MQIAKWITDDAKSKHTGSQKNFRGSLTHFDSANAVVCHNKNDIHQEQAAKEPKWSPNLVDNSTRGGEVGIVLNKTARQFENGKEEDVWYEYSVNFAQQELLDATFIVFEEQAGEDEVERHAHLVENILHGIIAIAKVSLLRDVVQYHQEDADALCQIYVFDAL